MHSQGVMIPHMPPYPEPFTRYEALGLFSATDCSAFRYNIF